MGITHSKAADANEQSSLDQESQLQHQLDDATTSTRVYKRHHDHNDAQQLDYHPRRPSEHWPEEEEKCAVTPTQDQLMISSMKVTDRRFSRPSVHPVEEKQHHRNSNAKRIISESLPPPKWEERDTRRGSSSLPVRCPPRSSAQHEGDAEYLSRLYDLRTWNMYKLITESRRNQRISYQPTMEEQQDDIIIQEAVDDTAAYSHNMIFAFDLE